jgi:hypothetical protein
LAPKTLQKIFDLLVAIVVFHYSFSVSRKIFRYDTGLFLGVPRATVMFLSQECRQPADTVIDIASPGENRIKLLF